MNTTTRLDKIRKALDKAIKGGVNTEALIAFYKDVSQALDEPKPEPKFKVGDWVRVLTWTPISKPKRIKKMQLMGSTWMYTLPLGTSEAIYDQARLVAAEAPRPEPKFKVGDWVTRDGYRTVCEIISRRFDEERGWLYTRRAGFFNLQCPENQLTLAEAPEPDIQPVQPTEHLATRQDLAKVLKQVTQYSSDRIGIDAMAARLEKGEPA